MVSPGHILQNRYHIQHLLATGGMGAVYQAIDQRFGSRVAVKECLFSDPHLRKAFEHEAQLLFKLKHNALPRVIDIFSQDGGVFLVMEFIPGDDLFTTLQKRKNEIEPKGISKPLDISEVLSWADQLLDALNYLHSQTPPILHRDIKPQNLKVANHSQIALLDFGLAKQDGKSIYGYSQYYSSFEQITNSGTDPRSDLYSLAATLYYLLTGIEPADVRERSVSLLSKRPDPLQPAHQANLAVPTSIAEILTAALSVDRDNRPQTALAMRKLLSAIRKAGVDTEPLMPPSPNTGSDLFVGAPHPVIQPQRPQPGGQNIFQRDVQNISVSGPVGEISLNKNVYSDPSKKNPADRDKD
jgi:serine/threonine protein kinase